MEQTESLWFSWASSAMLLLLLVPGRSLDGPTRRAVLQRAGRRSGRQRRGGEQVRFPVHAGLKGPGWRELQRTEEKKTEITSSNQPKDFLHPSTLVRQTNFKKLFLQTKCSCWNKDSNDFFKLRWKSKSLYEVKLYDFIVMTRLFTSFHKNQ